MGSLDDDPSLASSFNSSFGPARAMSFANQDKQALIMEISVLRNKLRAAEEEADSYRKEVNHVNHNIVVMHERERRLEEMVLELSFELGGKGGPPPKPKEYSVTPEEAIDRYIQMAVTALERDKRVWELKCEEWEKKAKVAEEKLAAAIKQPEVIKPPVEEDRPSGPKASRQTQTTLVGEVIAASKAEEKAKSKKKQEEEEDPELVVRVALLEKELTDKAAELKKKKQALQNLKQKQANTVEKATQRINEKKERIKDLEALLKAHNVPFLSAADAASPASPAASLGPLSPATPASTTSSDAGGKLPPTAGMKYSYKGSSVVVRWSGEEEKLGPGWWLGLEYLTEAKGKNNGTARGIEFFKCPDKHGVFAPWPACEKSMAPE